MGEISTDNLYHYTNKFKWIISILEEGFKFNKCEEKLPLTGFSSSIFSHPEIVKHLIHPEVVCFCDIPFSLVSDHINKYGEYCIGLTKDWGMKNGITPIRYVHFDTPDLKDEKFYLLKASAENYYRFNNSMLQMVNQMLIDSGDFEGLSEKDYQSLPKKWEKIISQMDCEYHNMITFTQLYLGNMRIYEDEWPDRVTGKKELHRFYDEREWRALKTHKDQTRLIFKWDDIVEIIISNKSEQKKLTEVLINNYSIDTKTAIKKIRFISDIMVKLS